MIKPGREAAAMALCMSLILASVGSGRAAPRRAPRHTGTLHPVTELSSGRVILSPALRRALAQQFPGFRQIGDCAPGDFDGNGLEDVALYLTNRRRGLPLHQSTWLFIGFLQTTSGTFHSSLIARRRDPSTVYDREEHRPRQFDDYGGFTVGMGTFTIATQGRRARQVRFENDVIIEPDSGNFRLWFFRAGQWHGAWEVGDDLGE